MFDRLLAAVCVAAVAVVASQLEPFATQYLIRSGELLRQAEARLNDVRTGLRFQTVADTVRTELERAALQGLEDARRANSALADASMLMRPIALATTADVSIRAATWRDFVPTLPLNIAGLFYVVLGIFLGFAAYEIVKFPVALLFQEPRRRRFKKRGALT
jgi:hypothetical protein